MVHKEPAEITCRDTVVVVTCSTPSHAAREKAGDRTVLHDQTAFILLHLKRNTRLGSTQYTRRAGINFMMMRVDRAESSKSCGQPP